MDREKFKKFKNYMKKAFEEVSFELVKARYEAYEEISFKDLQKLVIIIGLTGENKGRILFECTKETAEQFSVAMNEGQTLKNKDETFLYIAEFANMVCGNAATYMNNELDKREVKITPPVIFSGENLEIITPNIYSETCFYKGNEGSFIINTGFEEREK